MPAVTTEKAADTVSDLRQALDQAQDELVNVRRARRLADERAEQLQAALDQSNELSEQWQERLKSAREQRDETGASMDTLRSELRQVEQQLAAFERAAAESLLESQRAVQNATEETRDVQAQWAERLIVAERQIAEARLISAELRSELKILEVRHEAETARLRQEAEDLTRRLGESDSQRTDLSRTVADMAARIESSALQLAASEQGRASETNAFQQTERQLRAELDQLRAALAQVAALAQQVVDEPVPRWQRLGRLIGVDQASEAQRALGRWAQTATRETPTTAYFQQEHSPLSPPITSPVDAAPRNPYHRADSLAELLAWQDIDFVRCAYVTVLGRQPDPTGEGHFVERLRQGISKLQLLWELRTSAEGGDHDPGITGFDRTLRRFRQARLPFLGRLLGRRYVPEWSRGERRMRSLANQAWRIHREQQDSLRMIEGRLSGLDARIADLSARVGTGGGMTPAPTHAAAGAADHALGEVSFAPAEDDPDILRHYSASAVRNIRSKLATS